MNFNRSLSLFALILIALGNASISRPLGAADPIPLRAGPLTMLFEPDNAFLRYIRLGSHEVLRGINAPIRDALWGTVQPVVSNVVHDATNDGFTLSFDAVCKERDIDFRWRGEIQGKASGELLFTFDGEAHTTFRRNRIGFCVLHPASAAGKAWKIENVRGDVSSGAFPEFISPHQPAKEIRAIAHEIVPDVWAHVRMEGDTFEMEDQRNWTDASFKTYCTPLEIPYPVEVKKGTTISHRIGIRFEGDVGDVQQEPRDRDTVSLALVDSVAALPPMGLQVSSELEKLSDTVLERLKRLRLDHLRLDVSPADERFSPRLEEATRQARVLACDLHLGIRLDAEKDTKEQLERVIPVVRRLEPPIATWWIMGADRVQLLGAKETLGALVPGASFGAPRDGISFVELNRDRPAPGMLDIVAYHATPQIHASDNASITETLPIQGDTVRSARQFVGDAPLIVSPITFHTLLPGADALPGELPWNVDARQGSLFAAGWTVGSVKFLAEAGVQGMTYYETVGWRGVMDALEPPPRPAEFSSRPGEVFPIYHVLRDVAAFAGGRVQRCQSSDDLSVLGLLLKSADGERHRLLITNQTEREKSVVLRGFPKGEAKMKVLDAPSLRLAGRKPELFRSRPGKSQAMDQPFTLSAHAVLRLDF